ncbi:hypothetical protein GOBAR_DD35397 [Gossypium barbadense]|nr:hypothetical protein GOBAR_DD35397 [Gossypium barbadense]
MATKLSLTFRFPVEKSPKPRKSKPAVPQLNCCNGYGFSKNNSGFRGQLSMKVNAVQDEAIQSSNSETTLLSQTIPPSSSKLVLVVGATGGVVQTHKGYGADARSTLLVTDEAGIQ